MLLPLRLLVIDILNVDATELELMICYLCIFPMKVVRICAKSREAVSSPVEHLTLHYQVFQFVWVKLIIFSMKCVLLR